MGKLTSGGDELARTVVSGTFTGTGSSEAKAFQEVFNVSFFGTFAATVKIQKSYDGGATWLNLTESDGTILSWSLSLSGENFDQAFYEPEFGVLYKAVCTSHSSGTVNYRMSQ